MHILAAFVTAATAVRTGKLPAAPVSPAHHTSAAPEAAWQRATPEAAEPVQCRHQEAHPQTGRTAPLCFAHPWIRAAPPPETCTARTQRIHAPSWHRTRVRGSPSPSADSSCMP